MKQTLVIILFLTLNTSHLWSQSQQEPIVEMPSVESGDAAAGRLVAVHEPEYEGSEVHHLLYLPTNYDKEQKSPIIVEYTGNKWKYGDGSVEEAMLGYSITLGRDFIWVVLPYIAEDGEHNQELWWGDEEATTAYARVVIPRIIERYNGDPDRVVLCGFSRGAIAASYIGLRDDATAQLWSAFITHDHFDGEREWRGKNWGSPLEKYQAEASARLKRLNGRSWLISSKRPTQEYQDVIKKLGVEDYGNFSYLHVPIETYFDTIPNQYIKHAHTDRWALFDTEQSRALRKWLYNEVNIYQNKNDL